MASHQGPQWEMVDMIPAFPHDDIIASTVTDRMKCPISLQVMEDPAEVTTCKHTFEYKEIEAHLKGQKSCPTCRNAVRGMRQVKRVGGMKALIREVVHTCCVVEGCEATMSLENLEGHVKNQCQHTRFRCLQPDVNGRPCGHITTRDLQSNHHDSECPNRLVICQYCGNQVIASNRDNHGEICDARVLECRCGERYRGNERAQHRVVCGDEQIRCPICKDLMQRRQLEAHNEDPKVMARHMVALFHKVEEVEKENQGLRSRLRVVEEDQVNNLVEALGSLGHVEEEVDPDGALVVAIKRLVGEEGWRVMIVGDQEEKPGTVKVLVGLIKYMVKRIKETGGGEGGHHYGGVAAATLKAMCGVNKKTDDATRALAVSFMTQGAAQVLIECLRSCPTNRDVQFYGCGLVANLAFHDEKCGRIMIGAGVGPLVVESMRAFPNDLHLQRWTLNAILNLAMTTEGIHLLGEAGACDVIMEALGRFPQDETVVQFGYGALANLCSDSGEHSRAFCMWGVCEKVVAAMRSFPGKPALQLQFCRVVKCLPSGNLDHRRRLVEVGARQAVQSALEAFPDDEDIQEYGAEAFEALPA